MRVAKVFNYLGKPAFHMILEGPYFVQEKKYYYLSSSLHPSLLIYADPTVQLRFSTEKFICFEEANKIIFSIASKILKCNLARKFFYPDYLLFDNQIEAKSVQEIKRLNYNIDILEGCYSSSSNELYYYSHCCYYWLSYHFTKKRFEKRVQPSSRSELEKALSNQEEGFEYVERFDKINNKFFLSEKDGVKLYLMTNERLEPQLMIIK